MDGLLESNANNDKGALPKVLMEIVLTYARPTLCDMLAQKFPQQFVLFAPAEIGAPDLYADLFAKWSVIPPTDPESFLRRTLQPLSRGDQCKPGIRTALVDDKIRWTIVMRRHYVKTKYNGGSSKHNLGDCELLLVRPLPPPKRDPLFPTGDTYVYLYLHEPSSTLAKIDSNANHIECLESCNSAATLLETLLLL